MTRDLDPRLLGPFVVVAETLHFGRAAERLLTDQSSLSRQIARLESQIGARLLVRSSRAVELTEAGQAVLSIAREVVATAARAAEAAAVLDAEQTLRVHDLRMESPSVHRMLSRFTRARPHVGIRLTDGGEQDPNAAILAGTADVGVVQDFARSPRLGWARFAVIEYGVFTTPDHGFAAQERVAWSDFDGEHVFVAPVRGSDGYNDQLRLRWRAAGAEVTEHLAPANRSIVLVESLLAGRCIVVLPQPVIPEQAGLAWRPLDPPWNVDYGVAWDLASTNPAVHELVRWLAGERARAPLG